MISIQLSQEDSIKVARGNAYWDGFLDGVRLASEQAKQLILREAINKPQVAPKPDGEQSEQVPS